MKTSSHIKSITVWILLLVYFNDREKVKGKFKGLKRTQKVLSKKIVSRFIEISVGRVNVKVRIGDQIKKMVKCLFSMIRCAWGYLECILFLEVSSYELIRYHYFKVPDRFWVVKLVSRPHKTISFKDQYFLYLLKLNRIIYIWRK